MNNAKTMLSVGLAVAAAFAGQGYATPVIDPGEPPPPGWILNLNGQPIPRNPNRYVQYTAQFTAAQTTTHITFALRNDTFDAFFLDNVTVAHLGSPNVNLVRNGGFEDGTALSGGNANAPVDWQYLNPYGASPDSVVGCGGVGQDGSNCAWIGGPSQAYDLITQPITTAIGDTYQLNFWALGPDEGDHWQELNTFCCSNENEGNAFNIVAYAGNIPTSAVPEPAGLGIFSLGALLIGGFFMLRRGEQRQT